MQTAKLPEPSRELKVAMVQPDFPQTLIWSETDDDARFWKILALSRQALSNEPDLLIWPESGAPVLTPDRRDAITRLLQGHKAWMILCADSAEPASDGGVNVYNASALLDPDGHAEAIYHKRRLVMFGEYVPLVRWLRFLKFLAPIGDGFTPGDVPVTFHTTHPATAPSVLICFEDMFSQEARAHAAWPGADLLINLTNDGWFGEESEQWQQAASGLFSRDRKWHFLCCDAATMASTCWIDDRGRLAPSLGRTRQCLCARNSHGSDFHRSKSRADVLSPARRLAGMGLRRSNGGRNFHFAPQNVGSVNNRRDKCLRMWRLSRRK